MSLIDLGKMVKAKKEELAAVLKEAGERELKAELRALFDKFPSLEAVRWTQYTPYFNDGDPCVFRVNGLEFKRSGDSSGGWDGDGWYEIRYSSKRPTDLAPGLFETLEDLDSALKALDDGMADLFGDGKQILCTCEGIEITDYDHD